MDIYLIQIKHVEMNICDWSCVSHAWNHFMKIGWSYRSHSCPNISFYLILNITHYQEHLYVLDRVSEPLKSGLRGFNDAMSLYITVQDVGTGLYYENRPQKRKDDICNKHLLSSIHVIVVSNVLQRALDIESGRNFTTDRFHFLIKKEHDITYGHVMCISIQSGRTA